jgi:hypothetical protein
MLFQIIMYKEALQLNDANLCKVAIKERRYIKSRVEFEYTVRNKIYNSVIVFKQNVRTGEFALKWNKSALT